jgi:uncharacterized protein (TIGR02284 family)
LVRAMIVANCDGCGGVRCITRWEGANNTMETKLKNTESTLTDVIETLHDSHKGFADIGEHLKDAAAKRFFLEESLMRQQFAGELEGELQRMGEKDVTKDGKIGGTTAGAMHRTWGDLKAHLGGGDHGLLETAESGEDAAKKAYEKALEEKDIPAPIRDILRRQQAHVIASHDKVKAMRDAKKAA